jgi:hypothetical protein
VTAAFEELVGGESLAVVVPVAGAACGLDFAEALVEEAWEVVFAGEVFDCGED